MNPETYAFSHQNFREYLAARALGELSDSEIVQTVLAQAQNPWWEEVITLTFAYKHLPRSKRDLLLQALLEHEFVVLAGKCAVDAGTRLPQPQRQQVQEYLLAQMIDKTQPPQARLAAGDILDQLGWLPPDLNQWVRCPGCGDDGQDLLVMRYPVTNQQFALFIEAGGYDEPLYWGGKDSVAWNERINNFGYDESVDCPRYWRDAGFGREKQGYPVVGVSWYEAQAYAGWLTALLSLALEDETQISTAEKALIQDLLAAGARQVKLPTEQAWVQVAGGEDNDRYPWDEPGHSTTDKEEVVKRANINEAGLNRTSPVAMYPDGQSVPYGLNDLAGNVFEWTDSWYDDEQKSRVLRGGSWIYDLRFARVSFRGRSLPDLRSNSFGFRVVSPVGSGF
jgi:formylglycine-generating enzyme required for sulfatase activity